MPDKQDHRKTEIIRPAAAKGAGSRSGGADDSQSTNLQDRTSGGSGNRTETQVLIPSSEPVASGSSTTGLTTGWLVIVAGPGRGTSFALGHAKNSIGRGGDQTVSLDFGDKGISRDKAAVVIYDHKEMAFHLVDQGATNNVYHNGGLVVGAVRLAPHDRIQIGETTLMLVPLCGPDFDWQDNS